MNFDGAAPDFHTVPSASLGLHSIIHSCPHPHLRPDLRPPSALSSPVAFSSPVATGVPLWALCVGHPRVARRSALNRGTHCNEHRTGANRSHKSLQITGDRGEYMLKLCTMVHDCTRLYDVVTTGCRTLLGGPTGHRAPGRNGPQARNWFLNAGVLEFEPQWGQRTMCSPRIPGGDRP